MVKQQLFTVSMSMMHDFVHGAAVTDMYVLSNKKPLLFLTFFKSQPQWLMLQVLLILFSTSSKDTDVAYKGLEFAGKLYLFT